MCCKHHETDPFPALPPIVPLFQILRKGREVSFRPHLTPSKGSPLQPHGLPLDATTVERRQSSSGSCRLAVLDDPVSGEWEGDQLCADAAEERARSPFAYAVDVGRGTTDIETILTGEGFESLRGTCVVSVAQRDRGAPASP